MIHPIHAELINAKKTQFSDPSILQCTQAEIKLPQQRKMLLVSSKVLSLDSHQNTDPYRGLEAGGRLCGRNIGRKLGSEKFIDDLGLRNWISRIGT